MISEIQSEQQMEDLVQEKLKQNNSNPNKQQLFKVAIYKIPPLLVASIGFVSY